MSYRLPRSAANVRTVGRLARQRTLRAVRAVAGFGPAAVAAGVDRADLREVLTPERARGRCDAAALRAVVAGGNQADAVLRSGWARTPVAVLAAAVGVPTPSEVARHATRAAATLTALSSGDVEARWETAGNPRTSARAVAVLAGDKHQGTRRRTVANPACPPLVLAHLTADDHYYVRYGVAIHATAVALSALCEAPEDAVRAQIAKNVGCPSWMLARLASDASANVRIETAQNETCSAAVMRLLAGDDQPDVRWCVAYNMGCDEETLAVLAGDEDVPVRLAVAEHPSSSRSVLELLAQDTNSRVSACAAASLSVL